MSTSSSPNVNTMRMPVHCDRDCFLLPVLHTLIPNQESPSAKQVGTASDWKHTYPHFAQKTRK